MKFVKRYLRLVGLGVFLGCLIALAFGFSSPVLTWLFVPPIALAKYVAETLLQLPADAAIFYSLLVGTPATVVYLLWLIGRGRIPG